MHAFIQLVVCLLALLVPPSFVCPFGMCLALGVRCVQSGSMLVYAIVLRLCPTLPMKHGQARSQGLSNACFLCKGGQAVGGGGGVARA